MLWLCLALISCYSRYSAQILFHIFYYWFCFLFLIWYCFYIFLLLFVIFAGRRPFWTFLFISFSIQQISNLRWFQYSSLNFLSLFIFRHFWIETSVSWFFRSTSKLFLYKLEMFFLLILLLFPFHLCHSHVFSLLLDHRRSSFPHLHRHQLLAHIMIVSHSARLSCWFTQLLAASFKFDEWI
jgi:hypothetical protein